MNTKVIYTCIVGGYDDLKQPVVVYDNFDYICFSDVCTTSQIGVWQIKPIPYDNENNIVRSRYVKLNPHLVLQDYKYSVWIDSNIQIVDDLLKSRVELMISRNEILALVPHPHNNCIYNEAMRCVISSKADKYSVKKMIDILKIDGYPKLNGLTENNLIFRKHLNEVIIKVSDQWWHYMTDYCKRDQLSLCYILWKHNVEYAQLLPTGVNTNSKEHFKRIQHNHDIGFVRRVINKANKSIKKLYYTKINKELLRNLE